MTINKNLVFYRGNHYPPSMGIVGNTQLQPPTPESIFDEAVEFAFAASGYSYTFLVTTSGLVYVFGSGAEGTLGAGAETKITKPICLQTSIDTATYPNSKTFTTAQIVDIKTRNNITTFLSRDNTLFWCGSVPKDSQVIKTPEIVPPEHYENKRIQHFTCNITNVAVITTDQVMYMAGPSSYNQRGFQAQTEQDENLVFMPFDLKTVMEPGDKVRKFDSGGYEFVFITWNGRVFAWGHSERYVFKVTPTNVTLSALPAHMHGDEKIVDFSCGLFHFALLSENHNVYCGGKNEDGKCGTGNSSDIAGLVKVNLAFTEHTIIKVNCGWHNTVFVDSKNQMFGCGDNSYRHFHDEAADRQEEIKQLVIESPFNLLSYDLGVYNGREHLVLVYTQGQSLNQFKNKLLTSLHSHKFTDLHVIH